MIDFQRNERAIRALWQDPITRTQLFFGKSPYYEVSGKSYKPYQLGSYLALWGELYGFPSDIRELCVTGRGTGKTSVLQELNAADIAVFMPYFLQLYYSKPKPVDVTIIFVGSQKKYAIDRMDKVKTLIRNNSYLERHLVNEDVWRKDNVDLMNRCKLRAEVASDKARGYHSEDAEGVVLYLLEEFAFWGGTGCMSGEKFIQEVADQSFGSRIGAFTTPYGKRGGAWWAWNHPQWLKFNFPRWFNPRVDRRKLAAEIKRKIAMGRQIIVDQEIRGLFVDDVGLWFTMEIWLKSINNSLEWEFDDQDNYFSVLKQLERMAAEGVKKRGYYLLGADPNKGVRSSHADPFGLCLLERVGKKYFNRFASAYNGRSQEEIAHLMKLICMIYDVRKINFDGGGGYHTGPMAMIKGAKGVQNMSDITAVNSEIVRYMSMLRAFMAQGKFEQPPSESLRDSQMAMTSIGDIDEDASGLDATTAIIKFQSSNKPGGKRGGLPCDLAAMGLAVAKEYVAAEDTVASIASKDADMPKSAIETKRVMTDLNRIGGMGIDSIYSRLTSVGH
jgi:hypothetical protein